jgi:hypothetical protein
MNRPLIAIMAFAAFGSPALAAAQPYPTQSTDPAMSYAIVRIIPNSQADTRRDDVGTSPGCGAANPQGGRPSAVTWGDCP